MANIDIPESGIVNPPVVIQEITSADGYAKLSSVRPAVAMMEIDASLNVVKGSETIATADDFVANYRTSVIPAFVLDSEAEMTALTEYLNSKNIIDAFFVADEENAELLKTARKACPSVRGVLRFDSLTTPEARKNAYRKANDFYANVVMVDTPLTVDEVVYFSTRSMSTWCYGADTAGVYAAVAAGYSGVISNSAKTVYDVYGSITEPTVSGRPIPIGHRGYRYAYFDKEPAYPENTLLGYRKSLEAGATAVEIDLRLSSDGEIILMHDTTVDRTTNGTGKIADLTLAEIRKLVADEVEGYSEPVPTLEDAFAEFQDTNLVFYLHVNVTNEVMRERVNELLEQYDYTDRAIVFISTSNREAWNPETMADGLGFVESQNADRLEIPEHLDCTEDFISGLSPYNYQTLYYSFAGHMTEDFYYSLAARGYTSNHSITNTQNDLNGRLLLGVGATGALTDYLERTQGYCYYVDATDASYDVNEPITMGQAVKKVIGSEIVDCGFTQISGPEMVSDEKGISFSRAGKVVGVYYADVTAGGDVNYRVYSAPVTLTIGTALAWLPAALAALLIAAVVIVGCAVRRSRKAG